VAGVGSGGFKSGKGRSQVRISTIEEKSEPQAPGPGREKPQLHPGHPGWGYFTLLLSGISPLLNAVLARLDFHQFLDRGDRLL